MIVYIYIEDESITVSADIWYRPYSILTRGLTGFASWCFSHIYTIAYL